MKKKKRIRRGVYVPREDFSPYDEEFYFDEDYSERDEINALIDSLKREFEGGRRRRDVYSNNPRGFN